MSLYEYSDKLDEISSQRYKKKLQILGLDECPYKHPHSYWKDDPTEWPDFEMTNLIAYLVKFPRVFQLEAMENYKSTESHKFYLSGWVQTGMHQKLKTGFILMKSHWVVKPSYLLHTYRQRQRTNDPEHVPWVALNKTGSVVASHCSCMAQICFHLRVRESY